MENLLIDGSIIITEEVTQVTVNTYDITFHYKCGGNTIINTYYPTSDPQQNHIVKEIYRVFNVKVSLDSTNENKPITVIDDMEDTFEYNMSEESDIDESEVESVPLEDVRRGVTGSIGLRDLGYDLSGPGNLGVAGATGQSGIKVSSTTDSTANGVMDMEMESRNGTMVYKNSTVTGDSKFEDTATPVPRPRPDSGQTVTDSGF
jgi:hypothetical protein